MSAVILSDQFFEMAAAQSAKPFLYEKTGGVWQGRTYGEVANDVLRAAAMLRMLGVNKGDRVVIGSENCMNWAIADLAIMTLGALVVPSYSTNTVADHLHVINDSGAVLAITSAGELAEKMAAASDRSKACKTLVCFDDPALKTKPKSITVKSWKKEMAQIDPSQFGDIRVKLDPDDVSCLIYTSGTGGQPKGVMLTHRSISANVEGVRQMLERADLVKGQRFLSLLPLSHSYEHTGGLHLPVRMGAEIWYCESVDQVSSNLQEAQPTLMIAVPRLYEVLYDRIERGLKAKGGLSETLFRKAVALGLKKLDGKRLSLTEKLMDRALERLVRAKVRQRLGGRLCYFCSGGAPLNPDIGRFFLAIGVGILQGYGQTEASPVISLNPPDDIRISTVGVPVPGVDLIFDDDGQILVRGDMVMQGYWGAPDATADAIQDGWLHTGDIGEMDADGYVKITGRKKEIIVNSGGDNIAPARVEALLSIHPDIEQAMLTGDKRPWLAAVIVPSAEMRGLPKAEQQKHLKAACDDINANLSPLEKIRRFIIADEPFSIENGEMTPTLKVRRHVVIKRYAKTLDALYKS
ncbi:MAG: long-chain fatty acid--CoA ligase [Alphaproteobacteria bacterium]|nr:long-chain fatty acid--CoA ligase [Alphaproteobacteria bacterium]